MFVFYMLKKGRLSTHGSIFHTGGSHFGFLSGSHIRKCFVSKLVGEKKILRMIQVFG